MAQYDLLITNARLQGSTDLIDIGIVEDRIAEIAEPINGTAVKTIDAAGRLVTPTFVEPHIHLDKALTNAWFVSKDYRLKLKQLEKTKRQFTIEEVKSRASTVLKWAVQSGVTIFRTQIDVDHAAGLTALDALLKLREELQPIADIQVVAFPQEGLINDPEAAPLVREAMSRGANVVGGFPSHEDGEQNARRHIDLAFEIAKEFNADIDMHIDPDYESRTLEYLARKTISENYVGRVTASHAVALSLYDEDYARQVIQLVKKADLNIVVCPETNLISGPITRVTELLNADVNVASAQDNIMDIFNPLGTMDPLEVVYLIAYAARLFGESDFDTLLKMPTINAAKALRLSRYGLQIGNMASLNILDARDAREAIRKRAEKTYVIRNGKVIAENNTIRALYS